MDENIEIKEGESLPLENTERTYPEVKRKYRNITCKKCGTVYPSLYKECPECGYSFKRQFIKITITVTLILLILASQIFLIIRVNKLENKVTDLEAKLTSALSGQAATDADLTGLEYYQKNLIYDGANLSAFGDEYLIYALQDGCSACAEANQYIYNYLYYGYPDYIPMYFVTPDSANSIFFDTLNCESTPTLYRLKKGEVAEKAVGVDDVFTMLDKIVQEAQSSESE